MLEMLKQYSGGMLNFAGVYGVSGLLIFVFCIYPQIRRINKIVRDGDLSKPLSKK